MLAFRFRSVAGQALGLAVLAQLIVGCASQEPRTVTIGTGTIMGVYYPTGGAICRLVNKNQTAHGIRCAVESTSGSFSNINAIREGRLQFGMAQSDFQYQASKGTSAFQRAGAYPELRAVFSVHAEPFTVVVRKEANISTFEDLKGKRLTAGASGSMVRLAMEDLLQAMNWKASDFSLAPELRSEQYAAALCDNRIDGFFYASGHPSALIQSATGCGGKLVSLTGPAVDKLLAERPYYARANITGGLYDNNPQVTRTYGSMATVVSSAKVPADVVYQVVKAIFENFSEFKSLHPAFANLDPRNMIKDGLSAPLHDGAVKYYKEKEWM